MRHRRLAYSLAVWLLSLSVAGLARADWPVAPITLVVGFPEGSAVDTAAKTLRPAMERQLRTPIALDYRIGADGSAAAAFVAKARPDGYTILLAPASAEGTSLVSVARIHDGPSPKAEAGTAGEAATPLFGLFAPKGVSPEIAGRFDQAALKVLEIPTIREKLVGLGTAHREEMADRLRASAAATRAQASEAAGKATASSSATTATPRRPIVRTPSAGVSTTQPGVSLPRSPSPN